MLPLPFHHAKVLQFIFQVFVFTTSIIVHLRKDNTSMTTSSRSIHYIAASWDLAKVAKKEGPSLSSPLSLHLSLFTSLSSPLSLHLSLFTSLSSPLSLHLSLFTSLSSPLSLHLSLFTSLSSPLSL